jgi:hypothetical protein
MTKGVARHQLVFFICLFFAMLASGLGVLDTWLTRAPGEGGSAEILPAMIVFGLTASMLLRRARP